MIDSPDSHTMRAVQYTTIQLRVILVHDHINQVKYLEAADDPCDGHKEDGQRQQRDGDLEKLFHACRAVNVPLRSSPPVFPEARK